MNSIREPLSLSPPFLSVLIDATLRDKQIVNACSGY